jgi:1,4-dihydroxy-2-naphthoate octaprenyltransferase
MMAREQKHTNDGRAQQALRIRGQRPSGLALAIRVLRAPFFTASAVPVLLGTALAWRDGSFHLGYFVLTMVGALAIHAGLNVGNDYFDHLSGNDEANEHPTPFSGGSRVIQEGLVTSRQVLAISIAGYVVGIAIGLYLAATRGWPILWLGLLGVFFAVFNSAPPLRLSYVGHGLAELGVGVGFGPVTVLGAYYVQTQQLSATAAWASLPVAILIVAVLYINEFPDYAADKATGKQTPVVLLGRPRAVWGYVLLIAASYVAVVVEVALGIVPLLWLLALLSLPLGYRAIRCATQCYDADENPPVQQLLPANAATVQMHLLVGLLLSLGLILNGLLSV